MLALVNPQDTVPVPMDPMGCFLSQHFGDGQVYMTGSDDRQLFELAREQGLVTDEGYLTRLGYTLWLRSTN